MREVLVNRVFPYLVNFRFSIFGLQSEFVLINYIKPVYHIIDKETGELLAIKSDFLEAEDYIRYNELQRI